MGEHAKGQGKMVETAEPSVLKNSLVGKAGSDSAPIPFHTPDVKGRVFELAAEVARLVCVEDAQYVDDKAAHRSLDLAANELGFLLKLPEPEFANLWRGDDTLGVRRV